MLACVLPGADDLTRDRPGERADQFCRPIREHEVMNGDGDAGGVSNLPRVDSLGELPGHLGGRARRA